MSNDMSAEIYITVGVLAEPFILLRSTFLCHQSSDMLDWQLQPVQQQSNFKVKLMRLD